MGKISEYAIVYRKPNENNWHELASFFVDDYVDERELQLDMLNAVEEIITITRETEDDTDN